MALKYKTKSKEQEPNLVEVKMDEVGRMANDYIDLLQEIRNREETLESTGADLINALRSRGKNEIFVRGITLKVKEIKAKIKIAVKRGGE